MKARLIDSYKQASSDIWSFFKKHFDIKGTDKYWSIVVQEADDLAEKYEGTEVEDYARAYIVLVVSELNRRAKCLNAQEK